MKFITDNYIIIIIVGLFFVFALIGYLIDMLKNNKTDDNTIVMPEEVSPIEVTNIEEKNDNNVEIKTENNPDELLENYDKEN